MQQELIKLREENAKLIAEKKELVEALRNRVNYFSKVPYDGNPLLISEFHFLQSLLSKFEVPNQS